MMFEIEITDPRRGLCDVRKDRRGFLYDCDDVDYAVRQIRSRHPDVHPGDIEIIEPDGYRVRLDRSEHRWS